MRMKIKLVLIMILLQVSITGSATGTIPNDTSKLPERAVIISETVNDIGICFTMVDLDNQELVIVYYYSVSLSELRLRQVFRTGIIIDLDKQAGIPVNNQSGSSKTGLGFY